MKSGDDTLDELERIKRRVIALEKAVVALEQPAALPAPPAKELTQRDSDNKGFDSWCLTQSFVPALDTVWRAALAYRDKQNAEDLELLRSTMQWVAPKSFAYESLRRRCGLDQ